MQADLRDANSATAIVNHSFTKIGDDRHMPWAMVGIRPPQTSAWAQGTDSTIACAVDLCGLMADEQLMGQLDPPCGNKARIPTIACVANLWGLMADERLMGQLDPPCGSKARIPTIACGADLCGLLVNEQLTGQLDPLHLRNAPHQSGRTME
jgi:hypothetical protein